MNFDLPQLSNNDSYRHMMMWKELKDYNNNKRIKNLKTSKFETWEFFMLRYAPLWSCWSVRYTAISMMFKVKNIQTYSHEDFTHFSRNLIFSVVIVATFFFPSLQWRILNFSRLHAWSKIFALLTSEKEISPELWKMPKKLMVIVKIYKCLHFLSAAHDKIFKCLNVFDFRFSQGLGDIVHCCVVNRRASRDND